MENCWEDFLEGGKNTRSEIKNAPGTTPGQSTKPLNPCLPFKAGIPQNAGLSLNQLYNNICRLKVLENEICFIFYFNKDHRIFMNLPRQYLFRKFV